jgi:hypothetical protein
MISAIGTVMFWMIAAVGACIALFIACMMLIVIIGAPIALYCAIANGIREIFTPDPNPLPNRPPPARAKPHAIPRGLTAEQLYQWANREGEYRNT